jgi:hypothetical protein
VAKVMTVQRQAESSFARIDLAPLAVADGRRHVVVLPNRREQLKAGPP